MDSDDVVRRITSEVIKRLGADSPNATSPAVAPKPASGGASVCPEGQKALVLLTGGDRKLDQVLLQLERIAERSVATTVVLSPTAQQVVGVPAVRRAAPGAEVVTEGEVERLLEGVGAIYMPNMSLNAASKIGRLAPDSLVSILAVQGLMRGLPMVAANDSLVPASVDAGRVPAGVRDILDKLLTNLKSMDVKICEIELLLGPGPVVDGVTGEIKANPECTMALNGDCGACGLCVENSPKAVQAIVDSGADRISAAPGSVPASGNMASYIDHTLLKADATEAEIRKLCEEAREHVFASVCINPGWVSLAAQMLAGSPVKVCTVIGFPLGATTPTAKAIETRDAIANGANEIDMVINVGALKSGDDELVRRDIEGVVQAAKGQALVKVILETALLSREEKVKASLLAKMAGADFVKTSTGFSTGGATVEDIALMRQTVGPDMGVKASGGIRDRETADAMIAAGATRIGASASVAIATGAKATGGGY